MCRSALPRKSRRSWNRKPDEKASRRGRIWSRLQRAADLQVCPPVFRQAEGVCPVTPRKLRMK